MTHQNEAETLAEALDGGKLIDDSAEWADTLHRAAAVLREQAREIKALSKARTTEESSAVGR